MWNINPSHSPQVETLVVSKSADERGENHVIALDVVQPRLRRTRGDHVIVAHAVNEEFEQQLAQPFYFKQHGHGRVESVMFPRDETPDMIALKKGENAEIINKHDFIMVNDDYLSN